MPEPAALQGLRVLEWGDFAAVPYAARLLADLGADVLKIEPPQGDGAHRERPFPEDGRDPPRGGLFAYLNRGKRSTVLDLCVDAQRQQLLALIDAADVFMHDQVALAASALAIDAETLRRRNPRLVVLALTPFGLSGPRAFDRADELVLVASSGLTFNTPGLPDFVRDPETEPPLRTNAHLGELIGGLTAATAVLGALLQRDRGGEGDSVEVSKQEALTALWTRDLASYSYAGTLTGRYRDNSVDSPNHFLPVADGWASVVAFADPHWQSLLDLMGQPAWARDPRFATGSSRTEHWAALEPLLSPWLRQQSGKALLAQAQQRGIPCAPAFSIADAVDNEQVAARAFLVPSGIPDDDKGRLPGSVFVIDGQRLPTICQLPTADANTEVILAQWLRAGATRPPMLAPAQGPLPLSGLRVLDFGQYVAMPVAGQLLAFLGAEVIAVESRARIISRGIGPFAGARTLNNSATFNPINRNKRSCTLNLRTPEGVALARQLVTGADMVIENFAPGTMEKIGLGYASLSALKPELIMLSLSACGSTGPWKNYVGLHSAILGLSGMAAATGYAGAHPRLVGSFLPDPVSAVYCVLGALAGVYQRRRGGRGQHLELAMTEVLQSLLPETILDYTQQGREAPRIGNRHPAKAPHGIYRSLGEDCWLALSVSDDKDWQALCQLMGRPRLATDPRFADLERRLAGADALDVIISEWSRTLSAREAAQQLQLRGVAASPVANSRDLLADKHLLERGFVRADLHPETGPRLLPVAPWRFGSMEPVYSAAPLLGADNDYVLRQLLGLSSERIERLQEARVIY